MPTECRITQKELIFSGKEASSSIAVANKNSYFVIVCGVGYQKFEKGKLVANCKDKKNYNDVIYVESQRAYFIYIYDVGIFKQERGSNELTEWLTGLRGLGYTSKYLGTNEQENIITFQLYNCIRVIPITSNGSPGTQLSWKWGGAYTEIDNIVDHRVYGERGDKIAVITWKSKELILLKINLEENTVKERDKYTIEGVGEGQSKFAQCLAICPLKQILAVSLYKPHSLVLYKLQEDSAVILKTLDITGMVNSSIDAMTFLGYRGDDLLLSIIPYSYNPDEVSVLAFKYNTVEKTLRHIESLKKPAPVKCCYKMMITTGNTVLAVGWINKLLSIKYQ